MNAITIIDTSNALAHLTAEDVAQANYEVLRRAGRKESTRAQYAQTERMWGAWCSANGLNPANFEIVYIDAFFKSIKDTYSRTTLQNMLSHLRKSVEAIGANSEVAEAKAIEKVDDGQDPNGNPQEIWRVNTRVINMSGEKTEDVFIIVVKENGEWKFMAFLFGPAADKYKEK